jgi:deazaflavin-dependent oxidoreductase (nitroreductase family)
MARRTVPLLTATATLAALTWVWWLLDPGAPDGLAVPVTVSAGLLANVPFTLLGGRAKRVVVAAMQRYVLNPPIRLLLRIGVMPLGYALLETRGRVTGRPRATPVGNGWTGTEFWIIAEHGHRAGYVRNIRRDPRVRIKLRRGWRYQWLTGTAHLLPDDDPYARQRRLSRWHPLRALNAAVVRVMGTELLTIRVDPDPPLRRQGA